MMEEGRKHIDDLFREELQGYREAPDAAVWTSIEQRLPKPGRRRSFLWLWLLLMLALLSSLGYYAYKHRDNSPSSSLKTNTPAATASVEEIQEITPSENNMDQENTAPKTPAFSTAPLQPAKKDAPLAEAKKENTQAHRINNPTEEIMTEKADAEKAPALTNSNLKKETPATSAGKPTLPHPDKESATNAKNATAKTESQNATALPVPQEPQSQEKSMAIAQANAANKPAAPDPNKEKPINPKNATAKTESKNATALPILQEPQSQEKSMAIAQANAANKPHTPDPNKEKLTDTKTAVNSSKKENPQPPIIPSERAKGIPLSGTIAENEKNKPIPVQPESAMGKPITVETERAKGVPIQVAAEPNPGKPPITVNAAAAKKKPLYIEPAKEYGIKINQEMEADEENSSGNEEAHPSAGSGGGGSTATEKRKKQNRIKMDGGVKLGYDRGFAKVSTSNFTGNLFLQWNISPKTSIVLQPGIRYHSVTNTALFPQGSFHDITAQSLDSAHVYSDSAGISFVQRNFIYQNQYDSINVSHALTPQKYLEVELPLLLQYKLAENLSVLGGIQLAFGKVLQIQTAMQRYQNSKTDTLSFPNVIDADTIGSPAGPYPNLPELNGYFSYSTPSINESDQQKYKNPITNPARFGVMLGFSYEYKRRLLIDFLIRKNLSDLSFIPNEKIRSLYSQPYVRLTVGYKLFQSK